MFESFFSSITKAPEFPENFDWINSDTSLSLLKLKGHVIVLDFWTYCCINCMHMLHALSELEKKYHGKPVVFIGVHSGKFFTEQETKNVQQAVERYEITHPVVVDKEMTIWKRYQVRGWPTIIIIDPSGNIVYHESGEGQKDAIDDVIQVLLERHSEKQTLAKIPLKINTATKQKNSTLSFPGKISISNTGLIALSDSNHNRILVTTLEGKIIHTIGNGMPGLVDGSFNEAQFFRPQGVIWKNSDLYVADTENHAVRHISFKENKVKTILGTGKQGPWMSLGGKGQETAITSPWDLAQKDNLLYIAMAGNHQIWSFDIESDIAKPFAGTGQENIIDGQINLAQLAQPSGLALYNNKLYIADSEVSAVRVIDIEASKLQTIVGHGLFDFGYQDGTIDDALFQHPLGLCATKDLLFVADTYNSAIRMIDLNSLSVSTLLGKTNDDKVCLPGNPKCDLLPLYEPSDVEFFQKKLYITDTNNHLIRVFDLVENRLKTLEIN